MRKTLAIAGIAGAAAWLLMMQAGRQNRYGEEESIMDGLEIGVDLTIQGIAGPGPVESFSTSDAMRDKLKKSEALRLTPYSLGDGGWTVGYGHFEKNRADLPIIRTVADAEAVFNEDLIERGEKWVKLYVTVPLTQNQFDALVHIAYNMSPKSFKKFADAVNRGEGIEAIAAQSVYWVKPHLQNGIRNRRDDEIAMFNYGVYA